MTLGLKMGHRARLLSNASCLTGTKRIELGIVPALPKIDAMPAPRGPQVDDVDMRLAGEVHTELLEALTSWDEDPLGTLEELRFQSGYYED